MKENDPNSTFKASPNWCFLFMKRNKISIRRRTTIAQRLPDAYQDSLIEYQRYILKLRKCHQYPDAFIANADQTPLTFDIPCTQTMAFKGEKTITLKSTGNEKNRFTVMLGAYGDGTKMPPYVIFKRKTLPKNVVWPEGVIVRTQEKKWMDANLTKDWLNQVWCKPGTGQQRRMLVLDAFRCHRMPCLKAMLAENRTDLVIIPGGMTSQLQVMDVSCNRPFKQHMRSKWNEWMFSGVHSFTNSGNIRKPDLALIVNWIKESWDAVDPAVMKHGFKKCCLTNAMDGSEDDILWQDDMDMAPSGEEFDEGDVIGRRGLRRRRYDDR